MNRPPRISLRPAFPLLIALSAAFAPRAHAQGALLLTWNDCALSFSQSSNHDFACDTEQGSEELYCAFRMPQATGADVLGAIAVIDLQHSAPALPDWWQLAKSGGCRSGNLSSSADFTQNQDCVDPWTGDAVSEVQAFRPGEPRGGANQVRIVVVCGVVPELARALDATSMYYAVKLVIHNARTTGGSPCTGCTQPACLVLNSIEIKRTSGAPGGDLFIQMPGPGNANWALWRGGGPDCTMVPVKNVTWGRVKGIYR